MAARVPSVKLSNGINFPAIGLGTFKAMGNVAIEAVQYAIDVGYRHFDCAYLHYNEREIGKGLNSKIYQGVVDRDDLFLVSKVWNTSHKQKHVVTACRQTCELLNTPYLDLYLIHWPFGYQEGEEYFPISDSGLIQFSDVDYLETWKGMEDCCYIGLTKSIGLSNFNSEQIDRVLAHSRIRPVVNQVECNPNINQKKMIEFCKEREIVVTGYCPLGMGKRSEHAEGSDQPEAAVHDPVIMDIGTKYGKSPAQVILRYLYQNMVVPIPKATTKRHIIENIDIFDFNLEDDDLKYIDSLNKNIRLSEMKIAKDHKYYPFNIEF